MNKNNIITFRASTHTKATLTRLMDERGIDRTSIIKLALYLLDAHMRRSRIRRMSLCDIVQAIEKYSSLPFSIYSLGKDDKASDSPHS